MPNAAAAARLTELEVDEVSLVDRAAVRDADKSNQPMRFYAFKRDDKGRFAGGKSDQVDPAIAEAVLKIEEFLEASDGAPELQASAGGTAPAPTSKAQWSTAYINDLPDSSFAHIAEGGQKDEEGKTTPRSLRHLPFKDDNGKLDLPHLRDALSRLPQSDLPPPAKGSALKTLQSAAKEAGVGAGKSDNEPTTKEADPMAEFKDALMAVKAEEIEKLSDEEKKRLLDMAAKVAPKKEEAKPAPAPAATEKADKIPEAIQKRLDEQAAEIKKAQAEATEATLKLAKREMLAKVDADYQSLPGVKKEELVDAMIALEAGAPEGYKVIEPAMKAWNEAIKTGSLFKANGGDGGSVKIGSALAKAETMADALQTADPKLTRAKAMATVWKKQPKLYQEHLSETHNEIARPSA